MSLKFHVSPKGCSPIRRHRFSRGRMRENGASIDELGAKPKVKRRSNDRVPSSASQERGTFSQREKGAPFLLAREGDSGDSAESARESFPAGVTSAGAASAGAAVAASAGGVAAAAAR